jgi:hypothetical protein
MFVHSRVLRLSCTREQHRVSVAVLSCIQGSTACLEAHVSSMLSGDEQRPHMHLEAVNNPCRLSVTNPALHL